MDEEARVLRMVNAGSQSGKVNSLKRVGVRPPAFAKLSRKYGWAGGDENEPLIEKPTPREEDVIGKATAIATGFGIFKSIVGGTVLTLP